MQQQKRLNEAIVAYESAISYRPRLAREYLPTYLPTLPTYYQCHFQCDYIVLFIKGLDNKFLTKEDQIIGNILGYFEKMWLV